MGRVENLKTKTPVKYISYQAVNSNGSKQGTKAFWHQLRIPDHYVTSARSDGYSSSQLCWWWSAVTTLERKLDYGIVTNRCRQHVATES